MIVFDNDGEKMYGVTNVEKHKEGNVYHQDVTLIAGEFIEENLDILQEMIAKFKNEARRQ